MLEEPLESPGTIAIIGAGPIGLEAALYGRFLGYEVTVFEAGRIAERWRADVDQEVPFSPGRGLSPLAMSAVQTHRDAGAPQPRALPMTTGAWIDQSLQTLAESDLLADRVRTHCRVTEVAMAAVAADDDDSHTAGAHEETLYDDEPVPADFLLHVMCEDGSQQTLRFEAVIDTTGRGDGESEFGFAVPDPPAFQRLGSQAEDGDFRTGVPYFYRINMVGGDAQGLSLEAGWDRIRRLYAMLGDRRSLDLYRPLRQ